MTELADFLRSQPPFDSLDDEDLARLVAHVTVERFPTGATVTAESERLMHLWVVRTGTLEVVDQGQVIDRLEAGDCFGSAWLLSDLPVPIRVTAAEDSVCLRIADPRHYLADIARLRFSAAETRHRRSRSETAARGDRPLALVMRPVLWCAEHERIRDVAERLGAHGASCALVSTSDGVGIVTDVDFRRRAATGQVGVDSPVGALASVPTRTIDEGAPRSAALLSMVEHGVHHLVVLDRAGQPTGVVRAVDLVQADARDPLLIRTAIESAEDIEQLAAAARRLPTTLVELSDHGVAATQIGPLHATVVDAIVRRALRLRHRSALDAVPLSWVLLGSLARREPLPLSDVDTALVWDDSERAGRPAPADAIRAAAREILGDLERCGLRLCGDGANADNPRFSRSRSDWIAAARAWQDDPTREHALLLSAMVADSRPLTNPTLGRSLTATIRSHTRTRWFLRALLDEALSWKPPAGFIRDFVVHHSGEHRGEIDLKAGGQAPIVGLARWIAIAAGDASGSTVERLRRGAAVRIVSRDEADALANGFENIYALLLHRETEAIRAGNRPTTYIAPKDLDTLTRRHLRETFRVVAQVQARMDRDWTYRLSGRGG
jgi:CBS domain-containing protein